MKAERKKDPGAVRVSAAFVQAFEEAARIYKWDEADRAEMKAVCRADPEMRYYIERLVEAIHAWYVPDAQNNYIRLDRWLAAMGMPPLVPQRTTPLHPASTTNLKEKK